MSREIKFRVYCKPLNGMFHDFPFVVEDNGKLSLNKLFKDNENIFMQYTGLKDKNGKEIYEGDILELLFDKNEITVDDFHGYRFMFRKDQLTKLNANKGEVIGNIYENPELLGDDMEGIHSMNVCMCIM